MPITAYNNPLLKKIVVLAKASDTANVAGFVQILPMNDNNAIVAAPLNAAAVVSVNNAKSDADWRFSGIRFPTEL